MAGKQKSDLSPVKLAIQRELAHRKKVPCPKKEVVTILCRTPSFKTWTYTGSVKNANALGYLALGEEPSSPKVQSSAETPRLIQCSSPRLQIQMEQSLIKDEPYSSEPPGFGSPTPSLKDWIGPPGFGSKILDEKSHSHNSSYDAPLLVPFSSENPMLHEKVRPPRPNPNPDSIQGTNMARSQPRSPNPFPNTSNHLNQIQCPSTSVPTKPRPGSLKRKATENEELIMPCPNPTTKKSTDSLLCEVCHASCSSPLTMQQHLKGRPHKAKLEWMKLKKNNAGKRTGTPMCDVCQIWCSDRDGLEMHFKGQKHKAKLQELEICKKNGGGLWSVDKRPILCELCGVHSMNGDLFKMHLKGKQHAFRQELTRRGML